jgi:hypothetical protein
MSRQQVLSGNNTSFHVNDRVINANNSVITGNGNNISGNNNKIIGNGNTVSGNNNECRGNNNECRGNNNECRGNNNVCRGNNNVCRGNNNVCHGNDQHQRNDNQYRGFNEQPYGDASQNLGFNVGNNFNGGITINGQNFSGIDEVLAQTMYGNDIISINGQTSQTIPSINSGQAVADRVFINGVEILPGDLIGSHVSNNRAIDSSKSAVVVQEPKKSHKPERINDEPSAVDGEIECKICMDRSIKCIIRPCNHTICNTCCWELNTDNCPFCRREFTDVETFYM